MSRNLTENERRILELIQAHYGSHNTVEDVTWTDGDEAVLWVTTPEGSVAIMVHLTNLADWRADGTISEEELFKWLQINES